MRPDPLELGRRAALALLAAASAFGPARGQNADRTAVVRASAAVTGFDPAALAPMLDAVAIAFRDHGPALAELADIAGRVPPGAFAGAVRGTALEPLARQLAEAWYGGASGGRVLSYEDALAWPAAGLSSVPGQCAGAFGAWSEPPAT
jgi:hypothetical protein